MRPQSRAHEFVFGTEHEREIFRKSLSFDNPPAGRWSCESSAGKVMPDTDQAAAEPGVKPKASHHWTTSIVSMRAASSASLDH